MGLWLWDRVWDSASRDDCASWDGPGSLEVDSLGDVLPFHCGDRIILKIQSSCVMRPHCLE
jgi:hypothetical protein